ncbi:MAG: ribosomal-processing cysteine protease Prp [Oscillospiraceae bacterium]|jgi:uncharacterized protein YsxB (DUF464 family)|nr:ribosomal-processing cysteine protease Prp [Oscillospiraceae bacterium]
MIRATFVRQGERIASVTISGHALPPEREDTYDLVCASVSSAVFMAANTLTAFVGDCTIAEEENCIRIQVDSNSVAAQSILQGLWLHLDQIAEQYPRFVRTQQR